MGSRQGAGARWAAGGAGAGTRRAAWRRRQPASHDPSCLNSSDRSATQHSATQHSPAQHSPAQRRPAPPLLELHLPVEHHRGGHHHQVGAPVASAGCGRGGTSWICVCFRPSLTQRRRTCCGWRNRSKAWQQRHAGGQAGGQAGRQAGGPATQLTSRTPGAPAGRWSESSCPAPSRPQGCLRGAGKGSQGHTLAVRKKTITCG